MKTYLFAIALSVIPATSSAALTIKVLDWEDQTVITFTDCDIGYWRNEAFIDRDKNDDNALFADCFNKQSEVITSTEDQRFKDRGINHEEIVIRMGDQFFEFASCYVTEQVVMTNADSIRVECPTAQSFRNGFE